MLVSRFKVEARLLEPMLGTAPADPEIYQSFIASKKAKEDLKKAKEDLAVEEKNELTKQLTEEEIKLLPELTEENKGITVFRRNAGGLILMDFMARGFLKEAATAVSGT